MLVLMQMRIVFNPCRFNDISLVLYPNAMCTQLLYEVGYHIILR